jgi:glycosyltransferase involved in cell wall biosynthesis
MKIFVNARFLTQPLSGVQRYGIECSRQIKKLYHDVIFICPGNILHHEIADELGVTVIGKNTGHLWEQIDLPLYLAKHKNPPLLSLANTAPLLYSNNYLTIHDIAFYHHPEWNSKKFSAWYNILIPRLAYKCRHIFTVSETIKKELVKCYSLPPSKISVTYNGIGADMLAAGNSNPVAKEKMILSVGSFNQRKNHQSLVAGFMQSDIKNEYTLVIAGDRNKVFSNGDIDENLWKNSNVTVVEQCGENKLIELYRKAEIVASVSLYEGFGIPVLEGMYYGCKAVCSDIQVYRELYDKQAVFCDPNNIGSIASALNKAATEKSAPAATDIAALLNQYSYANSAKTILEKIQGPL